MNNLLGTAAHLYDSVNYTISTGKINQGVDKTFETLDNESEVNQENVEKGKKYMEKNGRKLLFIGAVAASCLLSLKLTLIGAVVGLGLKMTYSDNMVFTWLDGDNPNELLSTREAGTAVLGVVAVIVSVVNKHSLFAFGALLTGMIGGIIPYDIGTHWTPAPEKKR